MIKKYSQFSLVWLIMNAIEKQLNNSRLFDLICVKRRLLAYRYRYNCCYVYHCHDHDRHKIAIVSSSSLIRRALAATKHPAGNMRYHFSQSLKNFLQPQHGPCKERSMVNEWRVAAGAGGGNGMFHGRSWCLSALDLLTTLTSFSFWHIFCLIVGASMPENLFRT